MCVYILVKSYAKIPNLEANDDFSYAIWAYVEAGLFPSWDKFPSKGMSSRSA